MNILAVDDERLILESMIKKLNIVFPDAVVMGKRKGSEVLELLEEWTGEPQQISYAFLDIQLGEMSGIELAKIIKEKSPDTKIIFCTAYREYSCDAWNLHALGYLMKPVETDKVIETLNAMDKDWRETKSSLSKDIRIQTFRTFQVTVDGVLVSFEREKSKELLAYLVDQKGRAVTTAEIAETLWEEPYDKKLKSRVTASLSDLKKSLIKAGIGEILVKTWNHLSLDVSKIKCDVYDFLEGDNLAINSYRGKYLEEYSWAEFTNGSLSEDFYFKKRKNWE